MSENGWERDLIEKTFVEHIRQQRNARRWKIVFRIVWVLIFIALVLAIRGLSRSSEDEIASQPHTAVIDIRGTIEPSASASAENIIKALNKAYDQSNAKGIILRINSPGGSPVQAGIVNDEIRRLKQLHPEKPLYVAVEELCASGSYYIAVAADKIYVDKASMVGSIGVLINGFGVNRLMQRIGVDRRLITAGENKGFLDPFSPSSPEQIAYAKNMLADVHQQFIDVVRQGRGKRLKQTAQTFSGLIFLAPKAIEMGLADDYGSVGSVARDVIGEPKIVNYTEQGKFSDRLMKKFGASFGSGIAQALVSMEKSFNLQ